jgi:uncharacterized membrane protein YtjA (UPF0391 family)
MLHWTLALAVVVILLSARFFGIATESMGVMNIVLLIGRVVTITALFLGRRATLGGDGPA